MITMVYDFFYMLGAALALVIILIVWLVRRHARKARQESADLARLRQQAAAYAARTAPAPVLTPSGSAVSAHGTILRFDDSPAVRIADRAKKKAKEDEIWRASDPLAQKYTVAASEGEAVNRVTLAQFFKKSNRRYVAFDVETTGLSPEEDRIIEIAAVRVVDDQIVDRFQQLVDPGMVIPPEASAINGITDDMVKDCPMIERVLPAFLDFMGSDFLAAHNARFDLGFVGAACNRYRYQLPNAAFDTMDLARYWPAAPNKKLITLARVAGIAKTQEHRALGDAELVAGLIAAAREQMKKD